MSVISPGATTRTKEDTMRRIVDITSITLIAFLAACSKGPSAPSPVTLTPPVPVGVIVVPAPFRAGTIGSISIEMADPKPISSVDWGDQTPTMDRLGTSPRTVLSHTYANAGTYIVTATITMPNGAAAQIITSIPVQP